MTYEEFPVMDWATVIDTTDLTITDKHNIIGLIHQQRILHIQHGNYSKLRYKFSFDDREERWTFSGFFKEMMGKHGRFFIPSYKADYKLVRDVPKGDTTITVLRSYEVIPHSEHMQFIYLKGEPRLFKILAVEESFDDDLGVAVTHLTLHASFSKDLEKGCELLQNCYFGRWDSDTLTFDLDDILNSTASLTFREASKEEILEEFPWE